MRPFSILSVLLFIVGTTVPIVADEPKEGGLKVEVLDLEKDQVKDYIARVIVTVEEKTAEKVKLIVFQKVGITTDILPHGDGVVSSSGPQFKTMRLSEPKAQIERYQILVKQNAGISKFVVQHDDKYYPLSLDKPLKSGEIAAAGRDSFGPLAGLSSAKERRWSEATKRQCLEATVRVRTPNSAGTGVLIDAPTWLSEFVPAGYSVVITAAHVVPPSLHSKFVEIDTFNYDAKYVASLSASYEAQILSTGNDDKAADVAYIVFKPKEEKLVGVSIADSKRWYSREYQYLTVGCANGQRPTFRFVEVLQATRFNEHLGLVAVSGKSETGESGGPLFDPDGVLMGIRSTTSDEKTTVSVGSGILGTALGGEIQKSLLTSNYYHPSSLSSLVSQNAIDQAKREFEGSLLLLSPENRATARKLYYKLLEETSAAKMAKKG